MSRSTILRRSVATASGLVLAGLIAGASVPANAATPVVTTNTAVSAIDQPISNTNDNSTTHRYTYDLGMSLLTGGPDFMPAPAGADVAPGTNAYRMSDALLNGYDRSVGDVIQKTNGVLVAPVINGDQYKTVLVNDSTVSADVQEPFTGKFVIIAPKSGIIVDGYALKGAIKTKFWSSAVGGTNVAGFPTGVEYTGTNGTHAGAITVASQQFKTNTNALSEIHWTSPYGAHQVKGAIRTKFLQHGGLRTQGAPKTDERRVLVNGSYFQEQVFERGTFRWSSSTGAFRVS